MHEAQASVAPDGGARACRAAAKPANVARHAFPIPAAAMSAANPTAGRAAFRHPAFVRYWAARFLAFVAIMMQAVAIGWQVYDITHDPLSLGLVGLAGFTPAIGLALVTGHVADRFDRRRILVVAYATELAAALLLLALAAGGNARAWPIYGAILLYGTARAFAMPAGQALLPNLVPPEHFPNAVAWNSSAMQVAMIGGPALGGLLFALGAQIVYAVSASFLLAALLLMISVPRPARAAPARREPVSWTTLLAGIAFIRAKPAILGAISLDLFAVLFGGATALLPIYARDILHVGPLGLGILRSGPAIGAMTTALVLTHRPLTRHVGRKMFVCVAGFAVATIVFGLSTSFALSLAALVALGACDMISVFVRQTLVQIATPDQMRGRVSAVNSVFIGASNELGEFESGVTAAWLGTVPAVVIGGLGTLLVCVLWAWRFPQLRDIDRLERDRL
ncbi:MAG: MFS transporter [Dongiaceae bacterium]